MQGVLMRVGVYIPCYKMDDYIDEVIKYYDHYDELLVIGKDFKEHGQVNVRNEGLQKLRHCDYVWTVDSDEIILKADQNILLDKIISGKKDAAFVGVLDYASPTHIYEKRDHKPVVLVNPKTVEFYETRCVRYNDGLFDDSINMHHLGFVYPEEKMAWKKENYWNTGNKKEVHQIMDKKRVRYDTPKEIRQLIRKVKNADIS